MNLKNKLFSLLSIALLGTFLVLAPNTVLADEEDEEDNEVELTSAVITAEVCAKEYLETGDADTLNKCAPHQAFEGVKDIYEGKPKIVIVDITEGEVYKVKVGKDTIYYYELLEGFGGSIDGEGEIVAKDGDVPVVKFSEYEITPKPKPGFFKGCL